MSNRTLPSFPGVYLAERTTIHATKEQVSANGHRYAVKMRDVAGYRYRLRGKVRSSNDFTEYRDLYEFHNEHAGSYESFLYTDPVDSVQRRVHFLDDEMDATNERGGVYSVEFEMETVVL